MFQFQRGRTKALGVTLTAWMLIAGCGYGDVGPTAYEYAKALYSICNRRAADQLDSVGDQIQAARDDGEVSPREARWLLAIVESAREGEWDRGVAAARRMMADQVH